VPLLRWERRTALTGLAATAIAFGPARMAFGMLLPAIRGEVAMSAATAGAIASAAFASFALALVAASLAAWRYGPKLPVVVGCALATGGAALVSVAGSTAPLALGTAVAATSAGLCWTPFNAVAGRLVRPRRRGRVLSVVSTGSTLVIVAMALGALVLAWSGASWRWVWGVTALGGAAAGVLGLALLPPSHRLVPRRPSSPPGLCPREAIRGLGTRAAWPLHAAALTFGIVSASFSTFAVDHLATHGTLAAQGTGGASPLLLGGLVFLAFGLLGAMGFATDAIERRLGVPSTMALCFAAVGLGTATLALGPAVLPLALGGAGLVGAGVMVFSVLLSVGALHLFPHLPVAGFTAVVIAVSLGSILGPAVTGAMADAFGTGAALLASAALAGLTAPAAMRWRMGDKRP
jgi:predicted MFS family arabinose efflux permease